MIQIKFKNRGVITTQPSLTSALTLDKISIGPSYVIKFLILFIVNNIRQTTEKADNTFN